MLPFTKKHQFIEENISISSGNKPSDEKNNPKKIPIIRKDKKNDIIIDLSSKDRPKGDEDEKSSNSAEFSGQILQEGNEIKPKAKTTRFNSIFNSKKAMERYTERMKDRNMILDIEKRNQETERFQKEYEEKNSYKYLLYHNPQFQKMLNSVQRQLILIFLIAIYIFLYNAILYFNLTKKKFGLNLVNIVLSIAEISLFLILFLSLKMDILSDPDLSKSFRLFIIIEFSLQFVTFIFNIIMAFLIYEYIYKLSKVKICLIYSFFILIILVTIISCKVFYVLFMESVLILFNKKTEYAILMVNVQNNNNINKDHLSISYQNYSTAEINKTESNLISENENKIKNSKDDERYRNYNYFNRFHYSVTSGRKEPKYFKKINFN
jgi:hypothetical protein